MSFPKSKSQNQSLARDVDTFHHDVPVKARTIIVQDVEGQNGN